MILKIELTLTQRKYQKYKRERRVMLKFPIPFGARIIKTGLAVGISVYLADFF